MQQEEWRHVRDFENVYAISNFGRLASRKSGKWRVLSNRNSKGGYLSVVLSFGGLIRFERIHRLVYEAFIGELPIDKSHHIHHINANKQDNNVANLKLVTSLEHHNLHKDSNNTSAMVNYNKYIKTKKVSQYTLDGLFIAEYDNCKEASKATGVCQRNIHQVASKEKYNSKGYTRKQAGGFLWIFAN